MYPYIWYSIFLWTLQDPESQESEETLFPVLASLITQDQSSSISCTRLHWNEYVLHVMLLSEFLWNTDHW